MAANSRVRRSTAPTVSVACARAGTNENCLPAIVMRTDPQDEDPDFPVFDPIDDPVLAIETRRPASPPLALERFIVQPSQCSQSGWSAEPDDALPVFVAFANPDGELRDRLEEIGALEDLPHCSILYLKHYTS